MSIPTAPADPLAGYAPRPGVFDEFLGPDGAPRATWSTLAADMARLGSEGLSRQGERARRRARDDGVTSRVPSEAGDRNRPWPFDPVPLMIAAGEWREIEAGLIQRARLLEALLADLYGPRRTLRTGVVPSALVFANPAFLRPCHGVAVPGGVRLALYAADLGRGPDGRWRVLADRADAPAGVGYALENRLIAAECWPDLLRATGVSRLAAFFRAFRESLLARAASVVAGRREPRVVLLAPGADDETRHEHVYLARYLGLTLVEGGDLACRDARVHLKTLDGLKPVDLILRRTDAARADPLDLGPDGGLGVPGLIQAVRAGRVVVANAPGAGLVEAAGLAPYLGGACRYLLGEDLRLPGPPTVWCGEPVALAGVRDRLDRLTLGPAFPRPAAPGDPLGAVRPGDLDRAAREALLARVAARGLAYVAREVPPLSTAPALDGGRVRARPVTLRAYAAATGDGFVVLPGGLARVVPEDDPRLPAIRRGDGVKDAWVRADRPAEHRSLLPPREATNLQIRRGADIASRAADDLFWLGRYAERAEAGARALRGVLRRLTEGGETDPADLARTAAAALPGPFPPDAAGIERRADALLLDPAENGLAGVLGSLGRTTEAVRERLSDDALRTLRRLACPPAERVAPGGRGEGRRLALLDESIRDLAAFGGMAHENMTRAHGWRFLDVGRRLERTANALARLRALDPAPDPEGDGTLDWLLETADSAMTYRARYLALPQTGRTLDLLLLDDANPRAVAFQVEELALHVAALSRPDARTGAPRARALTASMRGLLRAADLGRLCAADGRGGRPVLRAFLTEFAGLPSALSDDLTRGYFRHTRRAPAAADAAPTDAV